MSASERDPVRLHGLAFDIAGVSEQGPRTENQDAFSLDDFGSTGLVAVADGMGGERSGRFAADTALRSLLTTSPIRSLDEARRAARAADHEVARAAQENPAERSGMGCALALLSLVPTRANGPEWIGAYVGDVRILSRSPDGAVRLETRDHTPAFARWEAGEIDLDEIPEAEGANRLQRAIGRGGEADVTWLPVRPGWSFLLISDGVTKAMRLDELGGAMAAPSAAATCEAIRRKVEERGPDDNYTALAIRVLGNAATTGAPVPDEATLPNPGVPGLFPAADEPHPGGKVPVAQPRGSVATLLTSLLAALALGAAGLALWNVWEMRGAAVARTEVDSLRVRIDSLHAEVLQLQDDPFGPTATPSAVPSDSPATSSPNNRP